MKRGRKKLTEALPDHVVWDIREGRPGEKLKFISERHKLSMAMICFIRQRKAYKSVPDPTTFPFPYGK